MDHRIPLKPNTPLLFRNERGEAIRCVTEAEIGRGGSCIVYEASRLTETGDKTLYRVKELYPYRLRISREEDGRLIPAAGDRDAFLREQKKFTADFSRANRLFYSGSNYASLTVQLDLFDLNGTSYILYPYSSKRTLAEYRPESLKECVTLVRQVAYVLGELHRQGYLYLDCKPENVLVIEGPEKHIQLFDFDSLVSLRELKDAGGPDRDGIRLSYSRGFAPIELRTSRLSRLGPQADVYGVGALLFTLLFGTTPAAPACEADAEYDFSKLRYDCEKCDPRLFRALEDFFHRALAAYYEDRSGSMEELLSRLNDLEKYADPLTPRIFSTRIVKPKIFYGREEEFQQLDTFLSERAYPCVFVTGMGGIGKSTFIREYLLRRRQSFDTVLYVPFQGSIEETICDDSKIESNVISRAEEGRSQARYFDRKLKKIRELVRDTSSLLVIDGFDGVVDGDLLALLETDLTVLLLSRKAPSFQNSYQLTLGGITDPSALRRIFEENLGRALAESELKDFHRIVLQTGRHTLVLELIAKQIAASHISVHRAAVLTAENSFSSIAPEKVVYERDNRPVREPIGKIIDALFEANALPPERRTLLKAASLTGGSGVDIGLFQEALGLAAKDELLQLVNDGWLTLSGDEISMHSVIREAVRRWPWTPESVTAAAGFLSRFHDEIRLEYERNDTPKKLLAEGAQTDAAPSGRGKMASLLARSEELLRQCKREPSLLADKDAGDAYMQLRMMTALNTPMYREEYILSETSELFPQILSKGDGELRGESGLRQALTAIKLCDMAVHIHLENGRSAEAAALLEGAKDLAKRAGSRRGYALYYNLLGNYYDDLLCGAYDPEDLRERTLLRRLLRAIEAARRYSKKDCSADPDHIYAKNTVAKATILMRSGQGSWEEAGRSLQEAKRVIEENTSPFAGVRLAYDLACAWYAALFYGDAEAAETFIRLVLELAEGIIPNDLERIENVLIPCANIYFELRQYEKSAALLAEGVRLCAKHADTDSYQRKKQELREHLLEVEQAAEKSILQKEIPQ